VKELIFKQLSCHTFKDKNVRFADIRSYNTKDSFGDMDILIESHNTYNPFVIAEELNAKEIVRNGDVTSVGIDIGERTLFQVDLIKTESKSFHYAEHYLQTTIWET